MGGEGEVVGRWWSVGLLCLSEREEDWAERGVDCLMTYIAFLFERVVMERGVMVELRIAMDRFTRRVPIFENDAVS